MRLPPSHVFVLLVSLAACGKQEGNTQNEVSVREENGLCPSVKRGSGLSGAPCFTHHDCAENCCFCPGAGQYAAAACVEGLCALPSTSCAAGLSYKPEVCGVRSP